MEKEILNYLKSDRKYESARQLYIQFGNRLSLRKQLNASPPTQYLHDVMHEEFRVMLNLPEIQFKTILSAPLCSADAVEKIDPDKGQIHSRISIPEQIKRIPIRAIKGVLLREEFPFLSADDCPDELKILVADMLSAYSKHKEMHEHLFTAENEAELLACARGTVENYLENREIWEELNHYKTTGTILGKCKKLKASEKEIEIEKLSIPEAVKFRDNLQANISRLQTKIKKNPKFPKIAEWTDKLVFAQQQMKAVKKRLDIK